MMTYRPFAVAILLCLSSVRSYAQTHLVCIDTTGHAGPCMLLPPSSLDVKIPGNTQLSADDMDKANKWARENGAGLSTIAPAPTSKYDGAPTPNYTPPPSYEVPSSSYDTSGPTPMPRYSTPSGGALTGVVK